MLCRDELLRFIVEQGQVVEQAQPDDKEYHHHLLCGTGSSDKTRPGLPPSSTSVIVFSFVTKPQHAHFENKSAGEDKLHFMPAFSTQKRYHTPFIFADDTTLIETVVQWNEDLHELRNTLQKYYSQIKFV